VIRDLNSDFRINLDTDVRRIRPILMKLGILHQILNPMTDT